MSAGTHHPGVEVGDAIAIAMSQIIPDRCAPQTYKYGSPRQMWGDLHPRTGKAFFDHGGEVNAGWVNAVRDVDGWGALVASNGNLIKASAEINEALFPHIQRSRDYLTDSGGAGQARDWPAPGTDARESSDAAAAPSVGPTPGRKHLQTLLRGASWTSARSLPHDLRMPWAKVRIEQSDCATCGTCLNLCPTGAITRRIENDRLSHRFNEALCIHCRLCEEACPQQVISFDVRLDAPQPGAGGRATHHRHPAARMRDLRRDAAGARGDVLPHLPAARQGGQLHPRR